jgi:hypothetical protein
MLITPAISRRCLVSLSLLTGLASCSVLGCGRTPSYQPAAVGGVVVWEDGSEPRELEGGAVEFEADGTVAATAELIADGTFRVENPLPPGTYRVRVRPPLGADKSNVLDPRFEKFETSGLTFAGTSEPQQVTFRVKKRGR